MEGRREGRGRGRGWEREKRKGGKRNIIEVRNREKKEEGFELHKGKELHTTYYMYFHTL